MDINNRFPDLYPSIDPSFWAEDEAAESLWSIALVSLSLLTAAVSVVALFV